MISRALSHRIIAVCLCVWAATAHADVGAELETLRGFDRRLATVAYRLTTANAALCGRNVAPVPGIVIHALGQYAPALRPTVKATFGFATPVAIEAVVPDSVAARAGLRENDALIAINDQPVAAVDPGMASASSSERDAVNALIARQPASSPLMLSIEREGKRRDVVVPAQAGCRAQFEILLDDRLLAQSDGEVIQLTKRHFERYDDDGVAIAVAHELSHTLLHHRARLLAAGVRRGADAVSARDRRITRRIEEEADRLSVHLLTNAGYDANAAIAYWRARRQPFDAFAAGTHATPAARAAAIADEIARMRAPGGGNSVNAILSQRDAPLSDTP